MLNRHKKRLQEIAKSNVKRKVSKAITNNEYGLSVLIRISENKKVVHDL